MVTEVLHVENPVNDGAILKGIRCMFGFGIFRQV